MVIALLDLSTSPLFKLKQPQEPDFYCLGSSRSRLGCQILFHPLSSRNRLFVQSASCTTTAFAGTHSRQNHFQPSGFNQIKPNLDLGNKTSHGTNLVIFGRVHIVHSGSLKLLGKQNPATPCHGTEGESQPAHVHGPTVGNVPVVVQQRRNSCVFLHFVLPQHYQHDSEGRVDSCK